MFIGAAYVFMFSLYCFSFSPPTYLISIHPSSQMHESSISCLYLCTLSLFNIFWPLFAYCSQYLCSRWLSDANLWSLVSETDMSFNSGRNMTWALEESFERRRVENEKQTSKDDSKSGDERTKHLVEHTLWLTVRDNYGKALQLHFLSAKSLDLDRFICVCVRPFFFCCQTRQKNDLQVGRIQKKIR